MVNTAIRMSNMYDTRASRSHAADALGDRPRNGAAYGPRTESRFGNDAIGELFVNGVNAGRAFFI